MQTIIATFDDRSTAQHAIDRLLQSGFSQDAVHLQHGNDAGIAASTEPSEAHDGVLAKVESFFSNLFSSDSEAHAGTYTEAVRRGSSVVVVDAGTDAELDKARELLSSLGSVDIDERAARWKDDGWTGYDANAAPSTAGAASLSGDTVVPIVQEELVVGKRTVDGGGLRVVKRMTETPVSQLVSLREERATIERRPVDRPASEADFTNFKEGTIEVREMSEEAVVGKTARVVEEVHVGKDVSERAETVSDSVRRTDVEVERVTGATTGASDVDRSRTSGSASTFDKSSPSDI